jgi:SAM-dependent methyltransferase
VCLYFCFSFNLLILALQYFTPVYRIKMEWFANWFDSPYYHILYQNRNDEEAHFFMDNLLQHLRVPSHANVLDLACGKGRHSIHLNQQGLTVTGVDLSPQSIEHAKQFESDTLHFDVHDMRKVYRENAFDYICNLFTSFGYFDNEADNFAVMNAVNDGLKTEGTFVIDFMNAAKVERLMVAEEVKELSGISFHITKAIIDGFIVKTIAFEDQGKHYQFQEKVQLLKLNSFEKYLDATRLQIIDTFGNYALEEFNEVDSDRLIIIAKKA